MHAKTAVQNLTSLGRPRPAKHLHILQRSEYSSLHLSVKKKEKNIHYFLYLFGFLKILTQVTINPMLLFISIFYYPNLNDYFWKSLRLHSTPKRIILGLTTNV